MGTIAISKLTSKHQLTLPQPIRRLLGVGAGDSVVWHLDDAGRVVLEPGRKYSLDDIRSAVAAAGTQARQVPVTIEEMKAGITSHIRNKHGRG